MAIPLTEAGKQADRLAFLGRLAGGLAHEIKNPLSTMTVILQLLKEEWAGAESSRERRTQQRIDLLLMEVHRLEGILNDFLRFARGPQRELTEVDVNSVLQEILDFVEPETTRFGIRTLYQAAPDLPLCRLDRDLFKQALFNVIINAQHAMEEGGGELLVKTSRQGDAARIQITDTGCGIPADALGKVFDVYFSTKRRGTGLGLPTARRFIEEHGGTIDVESEEGKGTAVTVMLPISADAGPGECGRPTS